jgi:hypothetical protein
MSGKASDGERQPPLSMPAAIRRRAVVAPERRFAPRPSPPPRVAFGAGAPCARSNRNLRARPLDAWPRFARPCTSDGRAYALGGPPDIASGSTSKGPALRARKPSRRSYYRGAATSPLGGPGRAPRPERERARENGRGPRGSKECPRATAAFGSADLVDDAASNDGSDGREFAPLSYVAALRGAPKARLPTRAPPARMRGRFTGGRQSSRPASCRSLGHWFWGVGRSARVLGRT